MRWGPPHSCIFFAPKGSVSDKSPNTWLDVFPGRSAQWTISFISAGSSQNTAMCQCSLSQADMRMQPQENIQGKKSAPKSIAMRNEYVFKGNRVPCSRQKNQ